MVRMPWRSARPRPATSRKRDEILTAALETFGAKGSNYGSLTDIAERVGMTHAGVLHHFGSKQNLLLEALTHRDRTDDPQLFDQPQVCRGAQRFLHMVRIAYMNARRPSKVRAFTVLRSESLIEGHAARTYFEESYRAQRNEVRQALGLLCEAEGVTDRARLDAACASILAVMDGLQLQWSLDPSVFDLGETTAFAITALVHEALAAGPPLEEYAAD